jgi:hypothetical protein
MPISTGFQVNEILTASNTNTYLLRPYRNAVINGAMQVSQRATSAAGIVNTTALFTADRWVSAISGSAGIWTQTVQNLSASDAPLVDGIRNSLRMTCTTATPTLVGGSYAIIAQRFEGNMLQQFAKGTSLAKHFSLSFWVRATRVGTYIIELTDVDNTRSVSQSYTITASGVWQKIRLTFPPDFTGLLDNDNNNSFELLMWFVAGTDFQASSLGVVWGSQVNADRATGQVNCASAVNNYFEFTGVQLEPGVVCTPFEVRSYAETLQQCLRYFWRIVNTPNYEPIAAAGVNVSAIAHVRTTTVLPTLMRKNLVTADLSWATLVGYDGAGILFLTSGAVVGHTATSVMVSIDWASSGNLTTGRPVVILTQPNAGFFQVNAELN